MHCLFVELDSAISKLIVKLSGLKDFWLQSNYHSNAVMLEYYYIMIETAPFHETFVKMVIRLKNYGCNNTVVKRNAVLD